MTGMKPRPNPIPLPGPEPTPPKADIFKLCPTCRKTTVFIPDEWDDEGRQIKEKHRICFGCLVTYDVDNPRLITAVVRQADPWALIDRYEEIGLDWGYDDGI